MREFATNSEESRKQPTGYARIYRSKIKNGIGLGIAEALTLLWDVD